MPLGAKFPRIVEVLSAIALLSFSTVGARAGDVVINQRYPVSAKDLSPPNVEATNECAVSVYVDGFVPHATVTAYINGAKDTAVAPELGFAAIPLTHPLRTGDTVTATQTVNGVTSKSSAPMVAGAMPATLPAPTVTPPIYACGQVVPVKGLKSGAKVEIRDTTAGTIIGNSATPNQWGNDWAPVGTSSLTGGHAIEARQSACTGAASPFSGTRSVSNDPSPVGVPSLDQPVVGNDAITAHDLLVGAELKAFNGGSTIGSGFATSATNYMKVSPKIVTGEKVIADQTLCSTSAKSPPAMAASQLTPPTLVAPICPGQSSVTVGSTTIDATLVLIKNTSTLVGYGGAAPGDVALNLAPPNVLAPNDKAQIAEYIGSIVAVSNVVTVGCHDVITYHNDNGRTGWNPNERTLTPANVKPGDFGLIATAKLDDDNDQVDGQPLIVTNQKIEGMGVHSVVYLATENDNVYAIDSFTGERLKKVNLGTPVPRPLNCENNGNAVGVNSTPTIDRKAGVLYVIAYIMDGVKPVHQLHMLDLQTLQDRIPPMTVAATNTLADGKTHTFDSSVQRQRPALLQANGNIYAGFGSYCDFKSSQSRGWALGWRQATLAPLGSTQLLSKTVATSTFNCYFHAPWTSNHPCYLASVWMSGYGLAADSSGNLFFTTGNTGVSDGGVSFYDSVNDLADTMVKMAPDLTKVDFFTPANVSALDQVDNDFGSGGTLVLPDQPGPTPHLAVAAGKDGNLYIVNRDTGQMGEFQNPNVPASVQIGGDCHCGQSYFKGSDGVGRVVTSGGPNLVQWMINTANRPALSQEANAQAVFATPLQDPGGFTSISSNGTTANTAIIWAVSRPMSLTDVRVTLYAFNATASGGALTQLWHEYAGLWPNTGGNANIVPTVANGMVYVASNKELQIFGLTRPSKTPKRMSLMVSRAEPAATSYVPDAGPLYSGTIRTVDGGKVKLELRTGRTITVDLSHIMPRATSDFGAIGRWLAVGGTLGQNGTLTATNAWRVKGPAALGPDRDR